MAQTIVRASRLIDGTGRPPAERMEVVIEGTRVMAVRAQGPPAPPDAAVIDIGHRTLLPGFVDAHLHFYGVDARDPMARVTWPIAYRAIRTTADAVRLVRAGFTSVRCMGSPSPWSGTHSRTSRPSTGWHS
jgi:imidazolonepropionase-like amidohydrolase